MTRTRAAFLAAALYGLLAVGLAQAQSLPAVRPEQVGLSSERLGQLTAILKADADKGVIPGAILLVARQGKVAWFETVGVRDPATRVPMTRDAIFRIYSMTKPITSLAVMMLVEDGKLALGDPVAKYIPQLGGLKVGVEKPDASGQPTLELQPARREMTVQDLLRHTSGLTYGFFGPGLVKKMYVDGKVWNDYPSNAELVDRLAKLPLLYQPGTTWDYSHSTDVLGRLIEVVSGQTLSQFFTARIFMPLAMKDTAFYVTDKSKHERIAEPFPNDRSIGTDAEFNDPRVAQKWESGGGGLVSTTTDYSPLPPDAAQWWEPRRQATRQPQDCRLHDRRPSGLGGHAGAALPARPRLRLRPGLRRAQGRGRVAASGHRRRVQLGRGGRHLFLGGPEGRPLRHLHDAVAEAAGALPGPPQGHDLRGGGEVRGSHRVAAAPYRITSRRGGPVRDGAATRRLGRPARW